MLFFRLFLDLICFKEFQKDNPSLVPQSLMSRGKKPNVSYLGNQFSRGYFSSGKKKLFYNYAWSQLLFSLPLATDKPLLRPFTALRNTVKRLHKHSEK